MPRDAEVTSDGPAWQPIGRLPLVTAVIDAGLAGGLEQQEVLLRARRRRSAVDKRVVATVLAVFTRFQSDIEFYDKQVGRWAGETLSPRQRREVDRLADQLYRFRQVVEDVLVLAHDLTWERSIIGSRHDLVSTVPQPGRLKPDHPGQFAEQEGKGADG